MMIFDNWAKTHVLLISVNDYNTVPRLIYTIRNGNVPTKPFFHDDLLREVLLDIKIEADTASSKFSWLMSSVMVLIIQEQ